jgi:hypothetical protein
MRRPTRAVLAAAAGGVLVGALALTGASAAQTPNDAACVAASGSGSTWNSARLAKYIACREDKQDAAIAALGAPSPAPSPEPSSTPTVAKPTAPPTPSDSPAPSVTPTTTTPSPTVEPTSASPTPTPTPTATGALDLPRVPWSGGSAFWAKYPKAKAAGWSAPSFFPLALWYGSAGTDAQVKFDKAHGINTYVQNNPGNSYSLLKSNGMFSLYKANGAPADDSQQVGALLDDEVDGRYSDSAGVAYLKGADAQYAPDASGLFSYVNYTSGIVTFDRSMDNSAAYLNGSFNDVIGVDQYFYSNPHCDTLSLRWRTPQGGTTIDRNNCRTASSYGKMVDLQHEVNAYKGGPLKPAWAFIEVVAPGGGNTAATGYHQPTGDQIQGAAWNSIIHGAAGIDWFSQAPDGGSGNDCPTGDAMRDAQQGGGCAALRANVEAVGRINAQITAMAPVLNTQSYVWNFGSGIDSALKVKDGSAYVFAMTKDGGTGSRTFTLPAGVSGTSVEVVGEGRTLPVSGGKFTDAFAKESDVHTYKIAL